MDDLQVPKMMVQNLLSNNPEQKRKMQGKREETGSVLDNKAAVPSNKSSESQQSFGTSHAPLMEQSQRVRQSKGNQELNNELKMKANELEKLFAEHKLRVPEDQSSSTRKQATILQYRKSATVAISLAQVQDEKTVIEPIGSANKVLEFNASPKKIVDHQGFHNSLKKNINELNFSDDSRGKFYEKYMQKRDAKLREEWGMKRAEKQAKLKAMQDSLEQSRAEMKARLSASADKKDSVTRTRRCSDHFRKSNIRSSMKKEQAVDSTQSEEDEELSELSEKKYHGRYRSFSEVSFVDVSSKSYQNKKLFPNRNSSSSTPRTTAVPLPRSSAKVSNSNFARRRGQSENPLAQSVPNFSDLRKENTKPSSGVSKTANRSQTRNYSRSKTTNEEVPRAKEEKHRRSQSLRKSTASVVELKDVSPMNTDSVALSPLKFDEEQIEQGFYEKSSKNVESKPFLKKGDGVGPGVGASVAKQKASVISETLTNGEEFESHTEVDDSIDVATREEEEEFETTEVEDSAIMNNGKVTSSEILLTEVEDRMGLSGSENGDPLRSLSHIDPSSVSELPSSVPSTYHAVGSLQDSPGESPVSWNSRMRHPFSYPNEASDIDASVDSPIGSPTSWNSHSLSQAEADAARMRKKWGSAQKPVFVANSSHNPSRKDVTKGFKRLLKFGRKSRGTDNLVDWISATTSDGDDDTEDGRDPASRSSEDLRKSRMGFSRGHPSDDSFNESELFNEHVQVLRSSIPAPPANFKLRDDHVSGSSIKAPRSFFSLSTFRSKGSDAKPR
uniref:Uncharacterized protein LOC105142591 isoform X2 n=1 Tax=Rhizophora mucronata TaxID=61149 RepID=A0A2P2LIR1_RHIMU